MTTTLARYSWPADRAGDWVRCSARPMLSRVCSVAGRSGSRAGVRRFADDCGHRVERRASARRALVSGIQSSLAGERHLRCVGPASPLRQPLLRLYHRRRPIFAGALPSSSGNRFRPAPGRGSSGAGFSFLRFCSRFSASPPNWNASAWHFGVKSEPKTTTTVPDNENRISIAKETVMKRMFIAIAALDALPA